MVNKYILIALFLAMFTACTSKNGSTRTSNSRVPDFSQSLNFEYGIKTVAEYKDDTSLVSFEYYNRVDELKEKVGFEYIIKFKYDSLGRLIEEFNCRIYNCEIGWTTLLKYDEQGNHIGSYKTTDSTVVLDTVEIEQTKFYNSDNRLTKEFIRRGSDVNGEVFELWNFYKYENGLTSNEIQKRDEDTLWVGIYKYNSDKKLDRIEYWRDDKFRFIKFEYDQEGRLSKKIFDSNLYELTDSTLISLKNSTVYFEYNSLGKLINEKTYNHRGELFRNFVYTYFKK